MTCEPTPATRWMRTINTKRVRPQLGCDCICGSTRVAQRKVKQGRGKVWGTAGGDRGDVDGAAEWGRKFLCIRSLSEIDLDVSPLLQPHVRHWRQRPRRLLSNLKP